MRPYFVLGIMLIVLFYCLIQSFQKGFEVYIINWFLQEEKKKEANLRSLINL